MNEDVLFGKYKIIAPLGKGGYSCVYLVRHMMLDCLRAIKVISRDNELHDRLVNEARILKNLHHESIPVIYDIEEDESNSYIVEEYCKGISLTRDRKSWDGPDFDKIIDYSLQICDVIDYLHKGGRGILYLDLKPSNIIVRDERLMLVDFGTAVEQNRVNDMSLGMGTRGYAAPEQYDISKRPDERSDIYGIGCIISFLVTGHNPIKNNAMDGRGTGIIKQGDLWGGSKRAYTALQGIIARCVMEEPDKRYLSVRELKDDLSKLKGMASHKKNSVGVISRILGKSPVQAGSMGHNKKLLIGVAATHSGAGATHLAMMMAQYYSLYLKKSTAVADASVSRRVSGSTEFMPDNLIYVDATDVTYDFTTLFEQGIDVVVADFGSMRADVVNRFNMADIKLVAAGIAPWEFGEFVRFCDRYMRVGKEYHWNYAIPWCNDSKIKMINNYYGCALMRTGFVPDTGKLPDTAVSFITSVCMK